VFLFLPTSLPEMLVVEHVTLAPFRTVRVEIGAPRFENGCILASRPYLRRSDDDKLLGHFLARDFSGVRQPA